MEWRDAPESPDHAGRNPSDGRRARVALEDARAGSRRTGGRSGGRGSLLYAWHCRFPPKVAEIGVRGCGGGKESHAGERWGQGRSAGMWPAGF